MDAIAQRLFATLSGLAAIIVAVAFFIQTISPAQADVNPQQTYATGKYQMQFQAQNDTDAMHWYILVYNTETGYSKFYYGDSNMGKIIPAAYAFNLPSSPL